LIRRKRKRERLTAGELWDGTMVTINCEINLLLHSFGSEFMGALHGFAER